MKNVKLNWSPVDPKYQVTNYHVFVGKSPDTMAFFSGINAPPMYLYPDQMGFAEGDTLYAAVSSLVELELPPPPDNFTIELVD